MFAKPIQSNGFTLLELLFTMAIIAVLSTVGFGAYEMIKRRAMMAHELTAARNLLVAFHLYSADNGGRILPGYKSDTEAVNEEGNLLHAPVNARYPWRLYPYIKSVPGTLLYNGNEAVMDQANSDYLVSVSPNLGMNTTFVGGHYGSGSLLRPSRRVEEKIGRFCLKQTSDLGKDAEIIVFLSARSDPEEAWQGRGYFEVQPPQVLRPVWSQERWSVEAKPSEHGFVDLRWGDKAVAALYDGSARLMQEEDLRDMRYWAPEAAQTDNREYIVGR